MLEIHYDNPQHKKNVVDTSGVSFQIVRKKAGGAIADYQPVHQDPCCAFLK